MTSKASNPAKARGANTGFGNVDSWAASDSPEYSLDYTLRQQRYVTRSVPVSPAIAALVAGLAFMTEARECRS